MFLLGSLITFDDYDFLTKPAYLYTIELFYAYIGASTFDCP